jgi:hypothetical protein
MRYRFAFRNTQNAPIVSNALILRRNWMQKDDFPEAVGPFMAHVNRCLNLQSWWMTDLSSHLCPLYIHPKWTELLSLKRIILKTVTLYVLPSEALTILILPSDLIRLIISVCTIRLSVSSPFKIIFLMTSNLPVETRYNLTLIHGPYIQFLFYLYRY